MARVTVGISYYNPGRFLRFAIQSVFAQSLQDWQLILINDGSTDDSPAFVRSISDPRVLSLGDGCGRGLSARLNQIAAAADSPFLARMDADDIMHPMRLERQLAFMQENSDVDVVGSYAYSIDVDNRPIGLLGDRPMPRSPYEVFVRGRFVHPSVLGKTAWFKSNPYSDLYPRAEDIELWARTVVDSTFARIPEPLLFYRELGISQFKKYLASSTQIRGMVACGFEESMSRRQRWSIIAGTYGRDFAYVVANAIGVEEWLVRRRSRSLTPEMISLADVALSEVLSTRIPEGEQL